MLKRVVYYFVVFVIACFVQSASRAVTCPDTTDQATCTNVTGCEFNSINGCKPCVAGKYYDTDKTCKTCPSDKPYSAAGSVNGISDCRAAQIACNTAGLTGCSGTIGGNANWDDNAGAYKYSTCTCAQSGVEIDHGMKSQTCYFNDAGNAVTNTCSETTVTSCDAGYYENGGACVQTDVGYYSGSGETTQKQCPYGSTCAAGAESINNCYFAADTVFKDSNSDVSNRTYILPANAGLSNSLKNAN